MTIGERRVEHTTPEGAAGAVLELRGVGKTFPDGTVALEFRWSFDVR